MRWIEGEPVELSVEPCAWPWRRALAIVEAAVGADEREEERGGVADGMSLGRFTMAQAMHRGMC